MKYGTNKYDYYVTSLEQQSLNNVDTYEILKTQLANLKDQERRQKRGHRNRDGS